MPSAITNAPPQIEWVRRGAPPQAGSIASRLIANRGNVDALRPFIGRNGSVYVNSIDRRSGRKIVVNAPVATGLFTRDDWAKIDEVVQPTAKKRLRFVSDVMNEGLTYTVPEGLGKMILQYQRVSDISPAEISMSGR